jgi:hypothetical protein
VRCSQAHRKHRNTGRGFKRILGISIAPISDHPRAPDGISTGRQIEYATVEEEYAARMTYEGCAGAGGDRCGSQWLAGDQRRKATAAEDTALPSLRQHTEAMTECMKSDVITP